MRLPTCAQSEAGPTELPDLPDVDLGSVFAYRGATGFARESPLPRMKLHTRRLSMDGERNTFDGLMVQ